MKKCILYVLILTLCIFSLAGCAEEEFVLRCGIKFGDTVEDVKSKETLKIVSATNNKIVTGEGEVAGMTIDSIIYRFDDDGKLISVLWNILDSKNNIFPPIYFDSLSESLSAKYGMPNNTDTETVFLFQGASFQNMLSECDEFMLAFGSAGPLMFNEWQIKSTENNNVKIELLFYQEWSEGFNLRLSYDLYTDEQLAQLETENAAEQNEVFNDI